MAGRVVAVTGAGSGIGRAVTRTFLEQGDVVHASDVSPSRLAETATELDPLGALRTHVVDVTDFAAVQGFIAAADAEADGLSVFVSCAGGINGALEEVTGIF